MRRSHLARLDEAGLDQFEALLTAPDQDVYAWLRGAEPVPPAYDNAVFAGLKAVCEQRSALGFVSGSSRLHRQASGAPDGLGRARKAMTPIWRRKRRGAAAARCCSWRWTMLQAECGATGAAHSSRRP